MIYDTDSFLAAGDEADVLGDAIAVRYDRCRCCSRRRSDRYLNDELHGVLILIAVALPFRDFIPPFSTRIFELQRPCRS